jgi:hypothetical protein
MKPSVVVLVAFAFGGCSYQLVSPPARMINLDTARTAAPGETVVGARGAAHAAVFDPGVAVATAGVRRGVTEGVELDADATLGYVVESKHSDINRNIYAGRVGFKAGNSRWAALLGGVGGGFSPAAGGFASIDIGSTFSYPNCYVIPFGGGSVFMSQPISAKRVDFRDGTGALVASDTADLTYGYGLGAGLEIPLDRGRCRQGLTPARVQVGLSANVLVPTDGQIVATTTSGDGTTTTTTTRGGAYGAFGAAVGVEFPF